VTAGPAKPPGSRRRAALFALFALLCAGLSASAAARNDAEVTDQLGEMRQVVVVERSIPQGAKLDSRAVERSLGSREVPLRFLPPDRLEDPSLALGARAVAEIPAGSYLTASLLRQGSHGAPGPGPLPLAAGLRPVEVEVSGGSGAPAGLPASGTRVDVLAADEPGSTSNPRVHVLARGVPLLAIEALRPDELDADPGTGGWLATLALDRRQSLDVIEADNYAREVRLLAR
jgi:Flp pilus assembly protein CpaB